MEMRERHNLVNLRGAIDERKCVSVFSARRARRGGRGADPSMLDTCGIWGLSDSKILDGAVL